MVSELLSVNLTLLKKLKLFWIAVPCYVILEIVSDLSHILAANNYSFFATTDSVSDFSEVVFPIAISIAYFLGRETSRGTVKNRIIAGYSRTQIFFSYFLIGCIISFVWMLVYFAGCALLFCFTGLFYPLGDYLVFMVVCLFAGVVEAALIVIIFLLSNGSTNCIIFSLIVVGLLWGTGVLMSEKVGFVSTDFMRTETGELIFIDLETALERGSLERELAETIFTTTPVLQMYALCDYWEFELYIVGRHFIPRVLIGEAVWLAILLLAGNLMFKYTKVR